MQERLGKGRKDLLKKDEENVVENEEIARQRREVKI